MATALQNAIKVVRCWWITPAPNFPPPSSNYARGCVADDPAFDDDPILVGGGGSLDDLPDTDPTIPTDQRINRPTIEHGVDTGNFDMLIVDVTQARFVGVFDVNGDGISLISRAIDQSGNVIESSKTARLYIRVNSERALGMPFSFTLDPSGPQKSDLLSLAARVQRVYIYCAFPTQDPQNEPSIVIVFTKGIAIQGLFGSTGIASSIPASPAVSDAGSVSGVGGTGGGGGSGPGGGGSGPTGGGGGGGRSLR